VSQREIRKTDFIDAQTVKLSPSGMPCFRAGYFDAWAIL
jgi:hypothetical protein